MPTNEPNMPEQSRESGDKRPSPVHLGFDGKKMKVLALGAHPDDIEIGCGGTLSRLQNEGHNILAVTFSEGEKGLSQHTRTNDIRTKETQEAMKTLGLIRHKGYNLPDTKLGTHILKMRDVIEEIMQKFEPDLVFTHSPKDIHQDHRAVHEATIVATRHRACSILCYENCRTNPSFNPSFFVGLDGVLEKKIATLKTHRTQNGKFYVDSDLILANAIFRGSQARLRFAEGFEVDRIVVGQKPQESFSKRVLVTGIGGPAGKAVASFLTKNSLYTVGVDMNPDVELLDVIPFYSVPAGNSDGFVERLLNLTIEERIQLLVPTVDEELIPLAEHKSLFEDHGKVLTISPLEAIRTCRDKYRTATFLRERGIPCVHAVLAKDLTHLRLPILVKPRLGRGGRGIAIFGNRLQLEEALSRYDSSFVFQEFVSGPEYDANLFIHEGEILVNQVLLKKKLEHENYGNALQVVKINDSEIEDLAAKAAMALKLEGPVDIDIRKDEHGTAKILEVNPRVGANVLEAEAVLTEMLRL